MNDQNQKPSAEQIDRELGSLLKQAAEKKQAGKDPMRDLFGSLLGAPIPKNVK